MEHLLYWLDLVGVFVFIWLLIRAITAARTPQQARIMAVDYRRDLFDEIPEAYRLGYSVSPDSTKATAAEALAGLKPRVPGADVSPEKLRARDWWQGPELFVLVDDYELLAGHDNPLAGLVGLYRQAFLGGSGALEAAVPLAVWTVVLLGAGWWLFRRLKPAFVDEI